MARAKQRKAPQRPRQRTPRSVPPMEYHVLLRKLADPDVPEEELKPYIETRPTDRIAMAPALLPNENVTFNEPESVNARARGNWVLGTLNAAYRNRRLSLFNQRVAAKDPRPIILAEGDSWFEYPLFIKDTIDHLTSNYTIFCMSGAGDELGQMVDAMEFVDIWRNLRDERKLNVRAMLFSAGGNDIVGDEFGKFLRPFANGQAAKDCLDVNAWKAKLATLLDGYGRVFKAVRKLDPSLPILVHAYDYANPLPSQGLQIPPRDGWLGEPMRKRGYADGPLQREIVKVLLEEVNVAFKSFEGKFPGVHFVDNRGIVKGRWFDELHPTDDGFLDVAANFRATLRKLGIK